MFSRSASLLWVLLLWSLPSDVYTNNKTQSSRKYPSFRYNPEAPPEPQNPDSTSSIPTIPAPAPTPTSTEPPTTTSPLGDVYTNNKTQSSRKYPSFRFNPVAPPEPQHPDSTSSRTTIPAPASTPTKPPTTTSPPGGLAVTNIALHKLAMQSSTWNFGNASRAVDGNDNPMYSSDSCTFTHHREMEPWWAVDLGASYQLEWVVLTNRGDCCNDKLSKFVIGTSDVNPQALIPTSFNIDVCHNQTDALELGETRAFKCEVFGRYVIVTRVNIRDTLTLCEVKVYVKNLALHKLTWQSSTANGGIASRAVDGRDSTMWSSDSCTHTSPGQHNPWWAVDLEATYHIKSVVLRNRGDCCNNHLSNFAIGTNDVSPQDLTPTPDNPGIWFCHYQPGTQPLGLGETRSFTCEGTGRYVIIIRVNIHDVLTLCEVEVYGTPSETPRSGAILKEIHHIDTESGESEEKTPVKNHSPYVIHGHDLAGLSSVRETAAQAAEQPMKKTDGSVQYGTYMLGGVIGFCVLVMSSLTLLVIMRTRTQVDDKAGILPNV